MGERGEFLPDGPTPCTVEGCPLEGVHLVNGRKYCGGHAAELIDRLGPPPRAVVSCGSLWCEGRCTPGQLCARPADAAAQVAQIVAASAADAVVQAWRAMSLSRRSLIGEDAPELRRALDSLAERWPQ